MPRPRDPFEGLPAYVKTAVESAGGLGSAAGDAVFQQLAAANKPAAVPPTPVVTPKPVPAPAPTGQVTDLDAILAAAMG